MGQNVINALKPKELMVKIVHDELTEMMGGTEAPLNLDGNPAVILMSGLQGAGKTTFAGKLARKLKSAKGKRPLLVGADVYRPAARELTSLRVSATLISVILPSPFNILNERSRRSDRFSNIRNYNLLVSVSGNITLGFQVFASSGVSWA